MAGNRNSGRRAKPTQLHVLQGTFRKDRHGDHTTPEPPAGPPEPPRPLTGHAKAEWDRMVARLEQSGTLKRVDDGALYQYVNLFAETEAIVEDHARIRKLSAELKKVARKLDGVELVEAIKRIVDLEYILAKHTQQLRQGHMAIRMYLVEFGMTPSARSRVKLPASTPAVDANKERFFGGASRSSA